MPAWPSLLPRPQIAGYGLNPVDQTVRTDMEVGSARSRRRTASRNDQIVANWLFTDAQMAVFRAFFDGDADGGSAWFSVDLAFGDQGLRSREARFVGPWQATPTGGLNWEVTAKLETRGGELTADQIKGALMGLVTASGEYPSLALDFAGDKTLDSRITFSRASIGTYWDADGVMQTAAANVARFDHNPVTGESLGLLIEESRTNLLLRSEDFSIVWSRPRVVVGSNSVVAPDGTQTADILTTTVGDFDAVGQPQTLTAAIHTLSFFVKAAGSTTSVAFGLYAGGFLAATGSIVSGPGAITGGGFMTVTGLSTTQWTRVSLTTSAATAAASHSVYIYPGGGNAAGLSVAVWGAQLEVGAFPTSYIPTEAAQATRQADAASMTGVNFSSWYRADAISVVAEALSPKGADPGGNSAHLFVISDSTLNERLRISRNSAKTQTLAEVRYGGVVQASIDTGALADNVPIKVAAAFMLNDFAFCRNGGAVGVDTSGLMPLAPTKLEIGMSNAANLTQWNSTIRKLAYYPARLTNAQLQSLTV